MTSQNNGADNGTGCVLWGVRTVEQAVFSGELGQWNRLCLVGSQDSGTCGV